MHKSKPLARSAKNSILAGAALAAALIAAPALASSCDKPAFSATIPDGSSASQEEMTATHNKINQFVSASEAYISCLGSARSTERMRNEMIDEMERVAAVFNRELRKYRRSSS
ncbi:MAG: hypothetical protein WC953_03595 [Pseudomonas sp.]